MYQYIVLLILFVSLFTGCQQKRPTSDIEQQKDINYETVSINTPSIMCGMCVTTIKNAVTVVDGVQDVEVNLENKTTTVKFDKSKVNISSLEKSISDAGYDANEIQRNRETYNKLPDCCKDGK